MRISIPSSLLLLLLLTATTTPVVAAPNCPPLGPVFEKPRNFASSPTIRAAIANLTATLQQRDSDNSPSVLANETSYSIEIFSAADRDTPLVFSWHHTAPQLAAQRFNATGVKKTDADTVYRLGSLTKVFTVYTWLAQDGDAKFNEPITKYVPELRGRPKGDAISDVDWEQVTVGSLASQMGGIVRDYGLMGEVTQQINMSTAVGLGFPPLNGSDSTLPKCGVWPLCDRTEFFNGLLQVAPSYAPHTTPAYTNTGFQILAYALESIKGKSFKSMMEESVLRPLGLNRTYYNNAPARVGIIPGGSTADANWDFQLGDESPAGNMFSSVGDISALGRSILRSDILSAALTRRWLKPAALTSEPNAGVGYPWGVRRVSLQQENGKRTIDAFNKAGRIGYYSSLMILLPDYDVGFSVLIAGPNIPGNTNFNLADLLGAQLLPALEQAGREQAESTYAGDYYNPERNSSLRITTQSDRPGLGVENWFSNGTYMQYVSVVLQSGYSPVSPTIRLYPTGLETMLEGGGRRVGYKAVFEDANLPARPNSLFSTDCGTWVSFTGVAYGTHPLDEFVFELDNGGKVRSVENKALRVVLPKV
ncbi:beta-lactamase/transpeptidase-like protein [Apodospora peruviana]|uniref:Beta-lactamase/transpeptidase-like protein n=1 Tax=Apodospora peruviana TaxID=516989 RepID=A0AAE0MDQ4_9PEZI|nr:beta-lactamase/transpeptidase-like protein [Apodospora peruviana]